jgi:hypothetical protein
VLDLATAIHQSRSERYAVSWEAQQEAADYLNEHGMYAAIGRLRALQGLCDESSDVLSGRDFFVTCKKTKTGKQTAFLLGPYETHEEALKNVERGRTMAEKVDQWAAVYAYGTASTAKGAIDHTVFGR